MNLLKLISIAGGLYIVTRTATRPEMKHFTASEFGLWWPLMNAELLTKLDAFRERWSAPVRISPAEGGIGRHNGSDDESQHNVDAWGEVRAVDVFPMIETRPGEYRYMSTREDRQRAYDTARNVGFTGIGLYTDTQPGDMLHVDTRKAGGRVALWSRVAGNYKGIQEVLT